MDFIFSLSRKKKEEQIGWDFGVGECLCACISLALMGGRNWVGRKKRETVFPQFSSLSCLRERGEHQESVPETSIGQQSILDRIHNYFQPPFHLSHQKREQEMTRGHGNLHKNHFFFLFFGLFLLSHRDETKKYITGERGSFEGREWLLLALVACPSQWIWHKNEEEGVGEKREKEGSCSRVGESLLPTMIKDSPKTRRKTRMLYFVQSLSWGNWIQVWGGGSPFFWELWGDADDGTKWAESWSPRLWPSCQKIRYMFQWSVVF